MSDALDLFSEYLRLRNYTPKTIEHRLGQLNRLDRWLGQTSLLEATKDQLHQWQASLTVCASSIQTYTSHVCTFYAWAHRYGHIEVNPALTLEQPRIKARMPRPIPEEHLELALGGAPIGSDMHAWLCLAGFCGLRAGEIAAMDRRDFRPDGTGGAFLTVHGKGGKERIVRVSPIVLQRLEGQLARARPMFRRPLGGAVTPNYLSNTASAYLEGIGLPYTLHTLRHRFATVLVDRGADIRDVQYLLGHGSLNTTSKYLAFSRQRGADSVDGLAQQLVPTK